MFVHSSNILVHSSNINVIRQCNWRLLVYLVNFTYFSILSPFNVRLMQYYINKSLVFITNIVDKQTFFWNNKDPNP